MCVYLSLFVVAVLLFVYYVCLESVSVVFCLVHVNGKFILCFTAGVELNSLWQDGVLVQYMACELCQTEREDIVPPIAALVVLTNENNKQLKPNQVLNYSGR